MTMPILPESNASPSAQSWADGECSQWRQNSEVCPMFEFLWTVETFQPRKSFFSVLIVRLTSSPEAVSATCLISKKRELLIPLL